MTDLVEAGVEPAAAPAPRGEGAPPPRPRRAALAWAGGWVAVLALAAWMQRLSPGWLALAAAGALAWLALAGRAHRGWRAAAGAALLAAVSIGGAAQFRLGQVAGRWDDVRAAAEERAGTALEAGLGALFERGVDAVDAVEPVRPGTRAERPLFERLEGLRRRGGVTALAVYQPDGSPLAWAGDHRGTVPDPVRNGQAETWYSSGPLFGYVYFTRVRPDSSVAVAAILLEGHLEAGEGPEPYAAAFARRYGVTPRFTTPAQAPREPAVWDWKGSEGPILSVHLVALTPEVWRERVARRGRWAVAAAWLAGALLLAAAWYRRDAGPSGVPIAALTLSLALLPLGEMLGGGGAFGPGFVLPLPGDVNLGQLLVVLAGAAVWLLARRRGSSPRVHLPLLARTLAAAAVLVGALWVVRQAAAPALLASRAAGGVPLVLACALLAGIPLLALLGQSARAATRARAARVALAVLLAGALALGVLARWGPGRALPLWTAALWVLPFALAATVLARPQVGRGALLPWAVVGWIAGSLALPHLWTAHLDARLAESEHELGRLGTQPEPFLDFLLRQFADTLLFYDAEGREGVGLLYQSWTTAGLAREGYEGRITLWRGEDRAAELRLAGAADVPAEMVPAMLERARGAEEPTVERYTHLDQLHYLLVVPLPGGRTATVAVPPRRYLGRSTALARLLTPGGEGGGVATLSLLRADQTAAPVPDSLRWKETAGGWESEAAVRFPEGEMHAHLRVPTPSRFILVARGVLAQVLVLAVFTVLWALARTLCGEPLGLASAQWGWVWSFRGRLTLALFAFFLLPMAAFAVTAYRALSREVVRTSSAVADRALGLAAAEWQMTGLSDLAVHVQADLLLYHRGELAEAAFDEVIGLGLYHAWLPPPVYLAFSVEEAQVEHEERRLGGHEYLLAYRRVAPGDVLAAPTPLASGEIARRQRELADVVLLAVLLGGALSVVLSLGVGRAFSRPIEAMSRAAAAVGGGDRSVHLPEARRDEFGGLFRSFNEMVRRLGEAEGELIGEKERTEAIVSEAGTGVVALDAAGRVALINPRACAILGAEVEAGSAIPEDRPLPAAVAATVRGFLAAGAREWTEEREVEDRVVRLRLRRLPAEESGRGAVLVLEDVTSELRSARVLAWGEMARQVAHEIKNPLTPMKLAVQHVRRAFADGRADFGAILDRNVDSVLAEIDRLGEIARAFSRFGTPAEAATVEPLERVDVARVAEETLALYRGGEGGIAWRVRVDEGTPPVRARAGELKEVLVNLLENARAALDGGGEVRIEAGPAGGGEWVRLDVADTGEGISPEALPRIFEPRFSTRTSGTGLGLAIVRRLVESWGGGVTVDSEPGQGTTVHLRLRAAEDAASSG